MDQLDRDFAIMYLAESNRNDRLYDGSSFRRDMLALEAEGLAELDHGVWKLTEAGMEAYALISDDDKDTFALTKLIVERMIP